MGKVPTGGEPAAPPTGAQSIRRAVAIMRAIAAAGTSGARLTDLAAEIGLHVATAHRLLGALAREGLVEQDPASKLYRFGPGLFSLSAAARRPLSIQEHFRSALVRLAEETEDTVYLSIRSGAEAICLARKEGAFPIRTLTLEVGSRRPLGVGAGSLALLAFLPDDEVERVIRTNGRAYTAFGVRSEDIRAFVATSRRLGYALNDDRILRGMSAVGLPARTIAGRVVAAVSVAAINARMRPPRREWIVERVRAEVDRLTPLPE
ncbi:MAG TPA: IclR family transcriptional regulator [Thermodesulfobacteriota bacterium]